MLAIINIYLTPSYTKFSQIYHKNTETKKSYPGYWKIVYLLHTELYRPDDLHQLDNNNTPSVASVMRLNTIPGRQGKKEGILLFPVLYPRSPLLIIERERDTNEEENLSHSRSEVKHIIQIWKPGFKFWPKEMFSLIL